MRYQIDYINSDDEVSGAVLKASRYLLRQYNDQTGNPSWILIGTDKGFQTFKKEWAKMFKSKIIGKFQIRIIEFNTREDAVEFILRWS